MGASIVSNSALICLTGEWMDGEHLPEDAPEYNWMTRILTFLAMEHCLMIIKNVISAATPEVPDEVQIQLDRQDFITSKLIDDAGDDIELPDEEAVGSGN